MSHCLIGALVTQKATNYAMRQQIDLEYEGGKLGLLSTDPRLKVRVTECGAAAAKQPQNHHESDPLYSRLCFAGAR